MEEKKNRKDRNEMRMCVKIKRQREKEIQTEIVANGCQKRKERKRVKREKKNREYDKVEREVVRGGKGKERVERRIKKERKNKSEIVEIKEQSNKHLNAEVIRKKEQTGTG